MASPAPSECLLVEDPEDTVPLSEILAVRDKCLQEVELWALCRECCLLLEYVQDSQEMFQAVSITPETIGFDSQGNLCFLYLDSTDPEPLFLPPEIEDGSDKQMSAHLYSLGMTMLYAAEYNVQLSSPRERGKMSADLSRLVGRMTADNPRDRPHANAVLTDCDKMLGDESSQEICADVAAICRMKSPEEESESSRKSTGPTLAEINSQLAEGHVNGVPLHVWNNREGHSHDSDSELADVFAKGRENNNNSKELVDPNLTQDGILYSVSTDPSNITPVPLDTGASEPDQQGEINPQSTCITDLLEQYTAASNQLVKRSASSGSTPVFKPGVHRTPVEGRGSKPDHSDHEQQMYSGLDYAVNGYHPKGLLVLEDDSLMSDSFDLNGSDFYLCENYDMEHNRKMSQSQGVTLAEVLEKKEGYLQEAELWAVCRESIKALQQLKKRLPAYISPDTLILREEGFVSFKAIPEDKPLEVVFMAPELQQKGLLSQKTCLYGLAITLRCAIGRKSSASPSFDISQEMEALLQGMLNKDLDKRPPLTEVLAICDDHEQLSEVPSSAICQFMFQDTATAMMESEAELEMSLTGVQTRAAQQQAELMAQISRQSLHGKRHYKKSNDANKEADMTGVRSGMDSSPAAVHSPNTGFNNTKPNGSAFKPVPGPSSDTLQKGLKRVPSKYSSSATHFTPIILQHGDSPDPASQSSSGNAKSEARKAADSNSSSRETEVVKKLKELKENLMKPRSNQNKENEGSGDSSRRTPPKKPPKPPKTEEVQPVEKNPTQVSLETIAHLLQNQGQLAQLNMLAATIAQLLQTSGYSASNSPSQTPLDSQNSSFQTQGHVPLTPNMRLPSLDVPQHYQDQLVGQTVTMPVQAPSGILGNYPVQLQLQQDPRTGLIQLVPVGMVPAPMHSRGSDVCSPATLPRAAGRHQSNGGYSSGSGSPHVRQSDGQSVHSSGRSSRERAHKSRSKGGSRNGKYNSGSGERNLRKAQSEHNLALVGNDEDVPEDDEGYHPKGHRTGSIPNLSPGVPNGGTAPPGYSLPVCDDGYAYSSSPVWHYSAIHHSGKQANGDNFSSNPKSSNSVLTNGGSQRHRQANRVSPTDSQSSSPSPSKDSGVSGVNSGGVNGNPGYNTYPKTDATLMDRLLGHDSIKQQQILQKVVALLREAFADEGCVETGGDDYIMAEYITSLAGLKWETFKCAIEEKYHDLIWDPDVLRRLHNTVNRKSSVSKGSDIAGDEESATQLDVSGGHIASSTPRGLPAVVVKQALSLTHSESKMSTSSVDTGEPKSDVAVREPCYRYSPTPRGGLHRFNPSQNLYNQGGDTCTSDSTDTSEYPGRKRRYKKRHQLNRSKNSSVQSSPSTPLDQSNSTHGSTQNDSNQLAVDTDSRSSSVRSREITPSRQGSATSSARGQTSPALPRLSEKSSSEDITRVRHESSRDRVENGLIEEEMPILYTVGVSPEADDELPIQFTSTPYNMAQQGRAACLDREESFQNGDVVKQLSYESYQETDDVFVDNLPNGQRKASVSSAGSVQSSAKSERHVMLNGNGSQNKSSCSSSRSDRGADVVRRNRGNVVYHTAELHYCMTPQLEHVIQELDPQNQSNLESRKSQLDQQVMMERRTKKKMQQFYKKLLDGGKPSKGDHKSMLTQVSKDIKDMTVRLKFMELAWGHVEMLLTELNGISPSLLHSLVVHPPAEPLALTPSPDNPLLQFQVHHDSVSNVDVRVLHAGTPEGLMSYLFTMSALADGYVHQFFYTFRYFATQHEFLDFLMDKYVAAKRNVSGPLNEKVMLRAVDLLYFWLEGYYTVDFERDNELTDKLQEFIINEVMYPDGYGATLLGLLQDCNHGNNTELSFTGAVVTDEIDLQMRQDDSFSPKKLPGFKAIMKSSPMKTYNPAVISTAILENRQPNLSQEEMFLPHVARRADAFTLTDYSSQSLAEQLALIHQTLFQKCHPVQYLNSKAQGIGVAMAAGGGSKPSANRSRNLPEESDLNDTGLFEGSLTASPVLQRLIKTGQEISHWVAAEIVSCSSIKSQLSTLTKFIYTAQLCMQMRNFATCVAISDGLENLIVRQLPVWKSLSSKCISIKEEMASIKMLLKNEPMCLLDDKEFRDHPTIPSILLFLMHVQQLEIGGFRLANGMFKWPKLRSLAEMVDQIRMFKDQRYQCDLDTDLHDILRHRIREMSCQDLQELASQHDTNYHKVSSRGIFSRMKGKLQIKGDKS